MSIVSRKEFARMCGVQDDTLKVHINRGKVIADGKGRKSTIDTENPINAAYLVEHEVDIKHRAEVQKLIVSIPKNPNAPRVKPSTFPAKRVVLDGDDDSEDDDDDMPPPGFEVSNHMLGIDADAPAFTYGKESLMDIQLRKLKGDADWVTAKAAKEQIMLDKVAGKMIPIDLMEGVFERFMKGVKEAYESGLENLANTYCLVLANGDITKYAEVMEKTRAILDQCLRENGQVVREDVDRIIDTYTETKRL